MRAGTANVGLTLMTGRGLRTAAWMLGNDLPMQLLTRMGRAVLACRGVLDAAWLAEALVAEDLAAGRLTPQEARKRYTLDTYTAGVVRAFATLAGLGAVTDLGDFPPLAAIKAGELHGRGRLDPIEAAVVDALLALPVRGGPGLVRSRLVIAQTDTHLAAAVPSYRDLAEDVAATWQLLADLHDRGALDVSAAASRRLVTGVIINQTALPDGYGPALSGKAARAAAEIAALRDFFADYTTCANVKFADYFGVTAPAGCCTSAQNRCSACWDYRDDVPATDRQPATATALYTPRPRPAGSRLDPASKARRLDEQVSMLCWNYDRGLRASDLWLALRGQDSWFWAKQRRRVLLPFAIINSRFFGENPSVTLPEVEDSCARLATAGRLVAVGTRWRDAGNVARQAARVARQAAAANGQTATVPAPPIAPAPPTAPAPVRGPR